MVKTRKKLTSQELLEKYPRINNGVSMTESRKILNKNGVIYTDEEIVRINKVMELLADECYKQWKRKKEVNEMKTTIPLKN